MQGVGGMQRVCAFRKLRQILLSSSFSNQKLNALCTRRQISTCKIFGEGWNIFFFFFLNKNSFQYL